MLFVFIIKCLVFSPWLRSSAGSCPNHHWKRVGPGCYQFAEDLLKPYPAAVSACKRIGGALLVPNSDDEMEVGDSAFVRKKIQEKDYYIWLGCEYDKGKNAFICIDDSQIELNSTWWPQFASFKKIEEDKDDSRIPLLYRYDYGLTFVKSNGSESNTLCEIDPVSVPKQPKHRLTPSVFASATDREGRPLIGYCRDDHVVEVAPLGGKTRRAVVCKEKCY